MSRARRGSSRSATRAATIPSRGALASILALAACAAPAPLTPRIVHGLDDTPLRGADTLVITVERGGVALEGTTTFVGLPTTSFEIVDVPLGTHLGLRVEARAGELPLARGRSFPFDYPSAAEAPPAPDVLIASLGRFTRTLETSDELVGLAPNGRGAIVASREGRVLSYLAHGGPDGSAVLVERDTLPARVGASFVAVPSADGASATLLAYGGRDDGATWLDGEGGTRATLAPRLDAGVSHVALTTASDGAWVVAVGGRDASGAALGSIDRIDLADGMTRTSLPPLPEPREGATVVTVPVESAGTVREIVLVSGGGVPGSVVLVDPVAETVREVAIEPALDGRALVAVETGLVVAAGGADALGVSDAVDLYVVRPDREPPIARLTPAPEPLFAARSGAVPLRLGPGLALFCSGLDDAGRPVRGAELVEVRLDALPADVVPTGALPLDARVLAAARLADHSVVVVGAGLAAAYVPPRGPE